MGRSPIAAFDVYVLQPLSDPWALQELVVKATPLALIAIGLSYLLSRQSLEYRRRGPIRHRRRARQLARADDPWHGGRLLGAAGSCCSLGVIGGALYGLIPAFLKTRFGVNEILTSLMLVYVADSCSIIWCAGPGAIRRASTSRNP